MDEAPDFDLLPEDPEGFFSLEEGFGLRDLKRAYARLVRKHKPERHPVEFQRIRAAYEILETRLRYLASDAVAGDAVREEADAPEDDEQVPLFTRAQLLAAVEERGADQLYSELCAAEQKTARDWYQLALLADLCEDEPLAFYRWLMKGVRETDGDPLVVHMLCEAVAGPVPRERAVQLLFELTDLLCGDYFWYLSEPLWLELLMEEPFEDFRRVFEECARRIGDEGHFGRLVLMLRILRRGAGKADPDFVKKGLKDLDADASRLPEHLLWELELVEVLVAYHERRSEFLAHDAQDSECSQARALRRAIDRAILSDELLDEVEGQQVFLESMLELADAGESLLDALPADGDFNYAWTPLVLMAQELDEDLFDDGLEEQELHSERARRRVAEWMRAIERQTDRSRPGRQWNDLHLLALLLGFLGFVVPPLYLHQLATTSLPTGWPGWLPHIVWPLWIAGFLLLRRSWVGVRMDRINPWFAGRCYARLWRREAARFLRRSHLPLPFVERALPTIDDARITNAPWMALHLQRDFALSVLSLAQRFAR